MPLKYWRPGTGATAFDGPHNYIGEDLTAWLVGPCFQHRDSDCLARHNFSWVAEAVIAASTLPEDSEAHPYINRTGSWAVGWTECLLIHPEDHGAIAEAEAWADKLADYPIANEDAFSELEWEEASEYWEHMSLRERVEIISELGGCSIFAARHDHIPDSDAISEWLRSSN